MRDYERRTENHEAMVYWATIFIMTRRLARYENQQPPIKRWGQDLGPEPTRLRSQVAPIPGTGADLISGHGAGGRAAAR